MPEYVELDQETCELIKKIREEKKQTQVIAARRCGMNRSSLAAIENGTYKSVEIDKFAALLRFLNDKRLLQRIYRISKRWKKYGLPQQITEEHPGYAILDERKHRLTQKRVIYEEALERYREQLESRYDPSIAEQFVDVMSKLKYLIIDRNLRKDQIAEILGTLRFTLDLLTKKIQASRIDDKRPVDISK